MVVLDWRINSCLLKLELSIGTAFLCLPLVIFIIGSKRHRDRDLYIYYWYKLTSLSHRFSSSIILPFCFYMELSGFFFQFIILICSWSILLICMLVQFYIILYFHYFLLSLRNLLCWIYLLEYFSIFFIGGIITSLLLLEFVVWDNMFSSTHWVNLENFD